MLNDSYSADLRTKIAAASDIRGKLKALKNAAPKDTPCVILSCGPSLTEYSPDELTELCQNAVVFAVKQAFEYVPSVSDFLLLNSWNYQKYDLSVRHPVVVHERGKRDPSTYGEHDMVFDITETSDLSQQLARNGRYDDHTFDKTPDRPWGPGVLYEVGFYLAHYMGFKSIVTLGWDVGSKNTSVMPHFYDRPSPHRTRTLARARWIRSLTERNRFLHDNNVLYNKPRIIPEEVDVCANASGDWYDWLTSQGIDLKVASHVSMVDKRIPRVRLEEVLDKGARKKKARTRKAG